MSFNWPSSPGSLFWPPDACLLPHNDNNSNDNNNHLQRGLFWSPDARLLPHTTASLQAEHLLARGGKVSNHKNILGINWTHGFEFDLIESFFLIQLWSQIWHLRQLDPRACCPSLADNDHPSSSWNNSLLRACQSCHWSGNPFTLRKIFFFSRHSSLRCNLCASRSFCLHIHVPFFCSARNTTINKFDFIDN